MHANKVKDRHDTHQSHGVLRAAASRQRRSLMRNRFWFGLFGALSRCLAAPDPSLAHCAAQPEPTPPIRRFPCLNASRVLQLPLTFGDPIARQVPLFIRWEDWHEYLPHDLGTVNFVQIGANCGKNTYGCAVGGDPVWSYATTCGWHGIAVEPVSYVFRALCRNYARWPRVLPLRGAVADAAGWRTMKLAHGESNRLLLDESRGTKSGRLRPRHVKNESVPVVTLAGLWAQRPRPEDEVDILAIDAEGAEALVLAGSSPLPRPRPYLILFEHAHLPRTDQAAIDEKLQGEGYRLLAKLRNRDPRGATRPPANKLYGRPR